MLNIGFDNDEEAAEFLRTSKSFIFHKTIKGIEEAIENDTDIVSVANLIVKDRVIVLRVEKPKWVEHLLLALEYFESVEDYEMCGKVKDLIDTIPQT